MNQRSTYLDEKQKLICKSGPSFVYVSFLVLGVIFFIELMVLSWPGPTVHMVGEGDVPTPWYVWLIPGFFGGLAVMALWYLLSLKLIRLYSRQLHCIRPLLLLSRSYPISKSTIIEEKPFELKTREDGSEFTYYSGLQCTIRFNEDEKLKLNSLEINQYNALIKHIRYAKSGLPPHKQTFKESRGILIYLIILFLFILAVALGYNLWAR